MLFCKFACYLSVLLIVNLGLGCVRQKSINDTSIIKGDSRFALHILNCIWGVDDSPYNATQAYETVTECYPEKLAFTIADDHIQYYDKNSNKIILTEDATKQLEYRFKSPLLFMNNFFLLSLDNELIYTGVFYDPHGAAAIRFPVIYPDFEEKQYTLKISTAHLDGAGIEEDITGRKLYKYLQKSGDISN